MHVGELATKHYILALFPSTRGMAFALFDGTLSLVDWGHTSIKGKVENIKCTEIAEALIDRYVPDEIVVEDPSKRSHPRSDRVNLLNQSFIALAKLHGVDVVRISAKEIRRRFEAAGARTKHERAKLIASMLPAISHKLPPTRKPWMSEDPRMALFEAAALGIAYYGGERVE